jgi:hypothetical protein
MKHFLALLTLLLAVAFAQPAAAQQAPGGSVERIGEQMEKVVSGSGVVAALDSLATASAPELQRTLDELTATLNVFATRIANDPELRTSALRAAQGLLGVAQVAIVEQSDLLQEALRSAADRLATLPEAAGSEARVR